MILSIILQAALTALVSLPFDDGAVPGVAGNAAFFDGINSRIIVPASELQAPRGTFTVDCWVCPVAFPKSPCPIAARENPGSPGGFSLWLDALGKVHFKVACAGEWVSADATEALELRKWSRITGLFRAGSSLRLAVNGKEVAVTPLELPAVEMAPYDLWIGRTRFRTPSFFENQNIPIYSSFDGAVDELYIHDGMDAYDSVLGTAFIRPEAPEFEARVLPSGPEGPLAFGSWYIPLKYYSAWDEQWRGSAPDVVVGFGKDLPFRVVFWKGISYAPCFVTEKGNWMCNEFIERSKVTGWGCPESMSDKHADFSSIRILENTPARTVVLWRNAPVGVNQKFPYQSEETQWGDWSEETYIFYPDGVGVRKMDVWSSNLTDWSEWCQSLQVLHPGQRPEDVLDKDRIMSVASMSGDSATFSWDFSGKARQHEPSIPSANIQVTYIDSVWNPFLILDDRSGLNDHGTDGPEIYRYAGRWSDYSDFPWRNHWPVAQDYVIGRYAAVADAASHTYTATQYSAPCHIDDRMMTKVMLCGCTDKDASDLIPLAKSWLHAPAMTWNGREVGYDFLQRAYILDASGNGRGPLSLKVEASAEHPVRGMCILIDGWKDSITSVSVDRKALPGSAFKSGADVSYDGTTLVVWLDIELDSPATVQLK